MIQALAIIPDKFLFSYSIQPGHGHADAIILWDLKRPGIPISRLNLWNPNTTVFKQSLTRIYDVVGLSVHDKTVLLACEYGYQVAVITVEDSADDDDDKSGGAPAIRVCGYASLYPRIDDDGSNFHGCMATSGNVAAMATNDYRMTWLFNINEMSSHSKLGRNEGNKSDFDKAAYDSDAEDEARVDFYAGRHLARGTANFPEPPSTNRIIGGKGPTVLAMRGKYLVAGYANGTIAHVKLPDDFAQNTGEGGLTSCCWLSSCEWDTPVLWHDKENKEAWAPFDRDRSSRWGNDSDDDEDDDDDDLKDDDEDDDDDHSDDAG
jgi:hypothetical protein